PFGPDECAGAFLFLAVRLDLGQRRDHPGFRQLLLRYRRLPEAKGVHALTPNRLVGEKRYDDRGDAGAGDSVDSTGAAVMDRRCRPEQDALVRHAPRNEDVVAAV